MTGILSKAKIGAQPGGRPPAAVEITPEGVMAAVTPAPGQPPVYAFEALPAGAVAPGIGEPNLRMADAVASAIRKALDQASPRTRAVSLVLPDTTVRVFVLDFDSLPAKHAEAIPVLKFRLRKMVPFDVEHAGVSYQILSESKTECRVLAAVLPGQILQEYEAAVRAAGYEPGAVLPSSLAALAAVESMEAVLVANLSNTALTTAISNGNDLLLYRTLDLPPERSTHRHEIQRGIAVAAAYYEDRLGARPRQLQFAGNYAVPHMEYLPDNETGGERHGHQRLGRFNRGAAAFALWIDAHELPVVELALRPATGAATTLGQMSVAAVTGALAGAS